MNTISLSKHSVCYEIFKEMILEKAKQGVLMMTMRTVRDLDVKKVANELYGPFAKVGAQLAANESCNPTESFHKNAFLTKSFY